MVKTEPERGALCETVLERADQQNQRGAETDLQQHVVIDGRGDREVGRRESGDSDGQQPNKAVGGKEQPSCPIDQQQAAQAA